MLIVGLLVFFVIFAVKYELADAQNAYKGYKPSKIDTRDVTLRKLEGLINYEQRTIKWRRAFVISVVIAFLIPLVVYQKFPTDRELLVIICIVYTLIIIQWSNYSDTVSGYISEYAHVHCKNLANSKNGFFL